MPKTLEEAVRAFEERCKQIGGCSNHGCVIRPVVGMGTNSICQCWSDKMRMQRFAYAVKDLRAALAADDGTVRVPSEPDMFWDADDPEHTGSESIEGLLDLVADDLRETDGVREINVMCACRMPTFTVRAWVVGDELKWEEQSVLVSHEKERDDGR